MLLPALKVGADTLARIAELRLLGILSLSSADVASILPLLASASCRVEVPSSVDPQAVRTLLDGGALHGSFLGREKPMMTNFL